MSVKLTVNVALAICLVSASSAQVFSDAAKLGANAGAMAYCRDNYMKPDDAGRYALLALRTADEFLTLNSRDRAQAIIFRNAALKGHYLDEALNADRCIRLRRLLSIRYALDSN